MGFNRSQDPATMPFRSEFSRSIYGDKTKSDGTGSRRHARRQPLGGGGNTPTDISTRAFPQRRWTRLRAGRLSVRDRRLF